MDDPQQVQELALRAPNTMVTQQDDERSRSSRHPEGLAHGSGQASMASEIAIDTPASPLRSAHKFLPELDVFVRHFFFCDELYWRCSLFPFNTCFVVVSSLDENECDVQRARCLQNVSKCYDIRAVHVSFLYFCGKQRVARAEDHSSTSKRIHHKKMGKGGFEPTRPRGVEM